MIKHVFEGHTDCAVSPYSCKKPPVAQVAISAMLKTPDFPALAVLASHEFQRTKDGPSVENHPQAVRNMSRDLALGSIGKS